ncbi:hypothetical protein DCAR_0625150 [Daucus carota subsp. sativus]|uniref:EXPERA domain-containing protein n=1 Tax=Daucus carota subsp. sativus TaxID=79200 RepID=A0AAF0XCX6_DAUCS|nr:PREDICTED: uncharacterized protein LOC108226846 [Daucus carota subsp. sativus]WOH05730.1 hypothetical protein DCAR_0625150 [Daucus carota subsp. sativus]
MLILMKLLDAITLLFLSMITAGGIVMDCHLFLPSHYYLKLMIDDYIREKRQYLLLEMPEFYKALLYYHLLVNWPLAVISLYGFTFRRFWFSTTTLILSISFASISVPVLGELIGSGRGSAELIRTYFIFFALAVIVLFCSLLVSPTARTRTRMTKEMG